MFEVLENYIEMEEPDVLEGDLATKQFLMDIAMHSTVGNPDKISPKAKNTKV